ncbi:MAG: hypothetical protein ABIL68_17770, partial [bacterium]
KYSGPVDGAGRNRREKSDIDGESAEMGFRSDFPFEDVDHITHFFEGEKGNSQRHEKMKERNTKGNIETLK